MSRPLSQLVAARNHRSVGSPRVITLHDHDQFGANPGALATAIAPDAQVVGLESPKGVFVGKRITGYTWFVGPCERPSPVAFGDALAEIERFLWDEVDRQWATGRADADLPFLLGVGQGAIMAVATALAVPDLLSGVIAFGSSLPIVPGWDPPLAPLNNLPILIVDPVSPTAADGGVDPVATTLVPGAAPVLRGDQLVENLGHWGGAVTRLSGTGSTRVVEVGAWLIRQEGRTLTEVPR